MGINLPQIAPRHLTEFQLHLASLGISSELREIHPAALLELADVERSPQRVADLAKNDLISIMPIIVAAKGQPVVVDGYKRLDAVREQGKKITCLLVDTSPAHLIRVMAEFDHTQFPGFLE